jgi:hypothetical protein
MRYSRRVLAGAALTTVVSIVSIGVLVLPALGGEQPRTALGDAALSHLSSSVALRVAASQPGSVEGPLREAGERLNAALGSARAAQRAQGDRGFGDEAGAGAFNADDVGLPQNEEAVNACRADKSIVLGGTNDYRGLLDPAGNSTGWHFSEDGGRSLTQEGLLPPVNVRADARPSGGDPVVTVDESTCALYMVDLNYDPERPFANTNGVGVYKSSASVLGSCPGGADPSCWPTRRAAAAGAPPHFLDKPWADVGRSGGAGTVVWITYSDFLAPDPARPDRFTASIKAVRCDAQLAGCSAPIDISGSDEDVQFSDVTIGRDGRTYVTWSEIRGELTGEPQTFIHKIRVSEPGSTRFGPAHVIAEEDRAIPFGGFLHANDFRIATLQQSEVVSAGGRTRIFDVWAACSERPFGVVCVEPVVKLAWSDDLGATWSTPRVLSAGGDNYFPTLSDDRDGSLAVAWYTNRQDRRFHNRQDVELVRVDAARVRVDRRQRVTGPSNETEADPLLGGLFIGDYIEVFADHGQAWTHYNANYRSVPLLGAGTPLPQQDNFLDVRGL